jgi:hypothetical protein
VLGRPRAGRANATSSALDRVLAGALEHQAAAVVLPAVGGWDAPGVVADDRLVRLRGVGTASLGERETALVVARAGEAHVAVEVDTASLSRRVVEGLDPSAGLVEVTGEAHVAAWLLGPVH